MSDNRSTLAASVAPPANPISSSSVRGLPSRELERPAADVLRSLLTPPALDLDTTSAHDFFDAFR